MKRRTFGLKTKVAICMLLFTFVLLPIYPSVSMAEDAGNKAEGADVQQEKQVAGDEAAAAGRVAAAGAAKKGMSTGAKVAIGALGAAAVIAVVAATSDDDAVSPPSEHP